MICQSVRCYTYTLVWSHMRCVIRLHGLETKRSCSYLIQSTLVISKSKGPTKTIRDIRTSSFQICSIEEKTIRTTKFHK